MYFEDSPLEVCPQLGGRGRPGADAARRDGDGRAAVEGGDGGVPAGPGMKKPWCLLASERRSARSMAALYGRRWRIETSFRDVKNPSFGMGMKETRVGRTDRRDRMLLVGALAMALLTLLGAAGEKLGYDRWLKTNTSKQRQHSLFR